jgi:ribosomal protein S18 acetylase RimI-like enzyme
MSTIGLRRGTPGDAPEIGAIWHSGWRDGHLDRVPQELADVRTEDSFRERAANRAGEMTVAVADGAVVGFVLVVGDEVEQLYVSGSHRGQGIADALMGEAERQIEASGHAKGWLAVAPENARARAFYERAGWRDEGGFDYEVAGEGRPIMVPCRRYTKTFSQG